MASIVNDSRNSTSFILCLMLDLSFPADGVLYKKCLQALENVLAWALFAPHNLSVVGVTTINSTPQQRFQFVPLRDSFSAISSVLGAAFRSVGYIHAHMTPGDLKDSMFMTINRVVLHLKEKQGLAAGQIVLTALTCRDGSLVWDALRDALDGLHDEEARYFDAMQVVQLSSAPSAQPRFSAHGPTREGRPAGGLAVVPVAADAADAAALDRLEATLRAAWFTPRWSELLPLDLELGAADIKCVASQCVMDPGRLPFAHHFVLLGGGASGGGGAWGGKDPRVLRGVARVSADGVCEGSLFGLPLRVAWSPMSAFRSHDDFHRNAHLFLALCESLADKDEHLVVKLQTGGQTTAASGHFILTPGEDCMLLRAIASAELGLPPPPPPPMQYDGALAARAEREVGNALDALPVEEQYRAKDFPSALPTALRRSADFPTRLSLQWKAGVVRAPTRTASPRPAAATPPAAPAPAASASEDDVVLLELSSDDDELPELNVQTVTLSTPASGPGHKLGTGGHPALQDGFVAAPAAPAKRKKFQPLHGVFKIRRH